MLIPASHLLTFHILKSSTTYTLLNIPPFSWHYENHSPLTYPSFLTHCHFHSKSWRSAQIHILYASLAYIALIWYMYHMCVRTHDRGKWRFDTKLVFLKSKCKQSGKRRNIDVYILSDNCCFNNQTERNIRLFLSICRIFASQN